MTRPSAQAEPGDTLSRDDAVALAVGCADALGAVRFGSDAVVALIGAELLHPVEARRRALARLVGGHVAAATFVQVFVAVAGLVLIPGASLSRVDAALIQRAAIDAVAAISLALADRAALGAIDSEIGRQCASAEAELARALLAVVMVTGNGGAAAKKETHRG